MSGWKNIIIIIGIAFLISGIGNGVYADAWIDGTPYIYEEMRYLIQVLGHNEDVMLAPSAVGIPEPEYKVGDVKSFYAIDMRSLNQYSLKATCRAVTDMAYVFVENGRSAAASKITSLLAAFDGIYDGITEQFGLLQTETVQPFFDQPCGK